MRFHTLVIISVCALAMCAAPLNTVASRQITVSIEVEEGRHAQSPPPFPGASAMAAIPSFHEAPVRPGEPREIVVGPHESTLRGNADAIGKLKDQIRKRHTESSAETDQKLDDLKESLNVLKNEKRSLEDRLQALEDHLYTYNADFDRFNDDMTPKELIDNIHIEPLKDVYTDRKGVESAEKRQQLETDLGGANLADLQNTQTALLERRDALRKVLDKNAPFPIKKIWQSKSEDRYTFAFDWEVSSVAKGKQHVVEVGPRERSLAVAHIAGEIQEKENAIHKLRVEGIHKQLDHVNEEVEQHFREIQKIQEEAESRRIFGKNKM